MSRIADRELRGYEGVISAGISGYMVCSMLNVLKRAYQHGIWIGRVIRHY